MRGLVSTATTESCDSTKGEEIELVITRALTMLFKQPSWNKEFRSNTKTNCCRSISYSDSLLLLGARVLLEACRELVTQDADR